MWTTKTTRISKANKETIWNIWTRVSGWNEWDNDVEYASISEEFKLGAIGIIKSKGGPKNKFVITECTRNKSFTNRSTLPLCTLDFIHTMIETNEGTEITHKVEIRGFFTFLFSRIIGKGLQKSLPLAVDSLIKQAENGK